MPPIQRDNVFWNISVLVDQALVAGICLHQAPYILQGSWPSVYRLLCVLNDRIRSLLNRRSMLDICHLFTWESYDENLRKFCCCSVYLTTSASTQTQPPLTTEMFSSLVSIPRNSARAVWKPSCRQTTLTSSISHSSPHILPHFLW